MEKKLMDVEKEIGELNSSVKSAHKRIDELQLVTKAFYDLASDVKVMVNEMTNMKKDIAGIKNNIEEYHHKEPNKLWFNVKNAILTGIVAAIVGGLMALIIK
jgi:peptidoglycan hydrolase CwlO-like protein